MIFSQKSVQLRIWLLTLSIAAVTALSCHKKGEIVVQSFFLPFPDQDMAEYYQSRVDSGEFVWFTDVKATASSFMNEQAPGSNISTGEVVLTSEELFHATADVLLPDKVLVLTMERPYKQLGEHSIWQVIKVEEKKWPKNKSR